MFLVSLLCFGFEINGKERDMDCIYLGKYSPVEHRWSVFSCSNCVQLYVPSVFELQEFCQNGNFQNCSIFKSMGQGDGNNDGNGIETSPSSALAA